MNPKVFPVEMVSSLPYSNTLFDKKDDGGYYFQSLGSGSCGNCGLLIHYGEALILDAGIGIKTFRKRATTLLNSTAKPLGILLTHDHRDHIKGAIRIAHELNIPIYATLEVCQKLRHFSLKSSYEVTSYLRVINCKESFVIGSFRINAFEVPHDASFNVGYSIMSSPGTFTIITDIGEITSEIIEAIKRSNYLVFESNYDEEMLIKGPYSQRLKERISGTLGHLSNHIASTTIAEAHHPNLSLVALCHLSGNNNTPTQALSYLRKELTDRKIPFIDLSGLTYPDSQSKDDEPKFGREDTALAITYLARNETSPLYKLGKELVN